MIQLPRMGAHPTKDNEGFHHQMWRFRKNGRGGPVHQLPPNGPPNHSITNIYRVNSSTGGRVVLRQNLNPLGFKTTS